MAKKRLYMVCVGMYGIGYDTNCGTDRQGALDLFKHRKLYEDDVYLKSYNENWGDEKIIKEFHRR